MTVTPDEVQAQLVLELGDIDIAAVPQQPPAEATHTLPLSHTTASASAPTTMTDQQQALGARRSEPSQPPAQPPAQPAHPQSQQAKDVYELKWITWNGGKVRIVMQNENGPCALLALANVLILRGDLMVHPDMPVVTFEYLVDQIGEILLTSLPADASDIVRANFQQNVLDAMAILPKTQTGLDVNIKLTKY